jgi:hypothetical protein
MAKLKVDAQMPWGALWLSLASSLRPLFPAVTRETLEKLGMQKIQN